MGYVTNSADTEKEFPQLENLPMEFIGEVLYVGKMTDLCGFFAKPMIYLGVIDGNEMLFYNGAGGATLFGQKHFWQSMIRLSKTRIFSMYSPRAGRDWNYVNGEWK